MSKTERLIDALPGIPMPVDSVTETLTKMWDMGPKNMGPTDFRASQLNLILHFGLKTSTTEAEDLFNRAISFAQKYPCRIVVLCPEKEAKEGEILEGKLFSQCYIGKNMRDLCCCEALILGYSIEESDFLDNQVSLWLESDLPIYHWFHRVPVERINRCYMPFLKRCRRVLYDSEVEGTEYDGITWPKTTKCSDLVVARNLPFRQHIGQFLSSFQPDRLVDGLKEINISAEINKKGLSQNLSSWQTGVINRIRQKQGSLNPVPMRLSDRKDNGLSIEWIYEKRDNHFIWEYDCASKSGKVAIRLDGQKIGHALHIEPLTEPSVLGEALFFG